jgi:hypothetical protein
VGIELNPYNPNHWQGICHNVSKIALSIFPHIKSKKLKSEIISNLFETQSAKYLTEQGFSTVSAESDREPDLLINNNPCEIKVTGLDHPFTSHAKWMGGKYSKRTSDYIFVMWNYQPINNTLYGEEQEKLLFSVIQCHVDENEWRTIDNGKENYYATIFELNQIKNKPHSILVGEQRESDIVLISQ